MMDTSELPRKGLALVVSTCMLLQSCTTMSQGSSGTAAYQSDCLSVGTLRLAGNREVRLNNQPANDQVTVCSGDSVSTGPDSGAYVLFEAGGYVQFDQNSDPIFRVLQELVIEVIGLNEGQIFAQSPPSGQIRVSGSDGNLETNGTQFNLRMADGMSVLTVIEGRGNLIRPSRAAIHPGEQVGYRRGALDYRRSLSPSMMADVTQWRTRYPMPRRDAPPERNPSQSSSPLTTILGFAGVISAGLVAHDLFKHTDQKQQGRGDRSPHQWKDRYPRDD
jgi:ferric-dicitrate binding protein FerR (iron transport regulator)